jgi:hypothetical protein
MAQTSEVAMTEDPNSIENVEIEPLSDEDMEGVAGGGIGDSTVQTSSGPSCCSCSGCSDHN